MQVHKTQTFTPTHKAWRREVLQYTSCGKQVVSHRNDTSFFRNNDFWEDLVSFITEKFKNSDKVNVYDYACSNGSEAYTFLMQLYSSSDSATVDKFTPITAKDSDPEAIKMAKSGILPIQGYEVEKIQEYTRGKLEEFFDVAKGFKIKSREMTEIPLKKHYADKIEFSIGNITEDYENISPDDSVVFARNFMPYLKSRGMIIELIKNLGEKLKEGSCLVVGDFDHLGLCTYRINLQEILYSFGFKQTSVKNVYEKKAKPLLGMGFLTQA